jgi:hypothetical protein
MGAMMKRSRPTKLRIGSLSAYQPRVARSSQTAADVKNSLGEGKKDRNTAGLQLDLVI